MLLYIFVIRLGAYFTMLTGSIMILSCFAFGIIILNDPKMKIPFANPEEMAVFVDPQFGWSWYLTLFTGIGVLVLGGVVLALDFFIPRKIATVFHHSIVEEDEFFAVSEFFKITFMLFSFIFLPLAIHRRSMRRRKRQGSQA